LKPARRKLLKNQERAFKVALAQHNLEVSGFSLSNPPPSNHLLFNAYQLVRSQAKRDRKAAIIENRPKDLSNADMRLDSPMEYGGDTRWSLTCY
jgi:hypothetical protein